VTLIRNTHPTPNVPFPANRVGVASWTVDNLCAKGDNWTDVAAAIQNQINQWNANNGGAGGADHVYGGTIIPASPVGDSDGDYVFFCLSVWNPIAQPIVDHFTPKEANPKAVNLIRWKYLHDQSFGVTWEGQSMGDTQALIHSGRASTTLYSHEMGHAMHLIHFLGGNFGWKHHDLNFPQCMMSYSHMTHRIAKPGGAVGANGASLENGGWPHQIGTTGNYSINFPTLRSQNIALDKPCARCMLKLQGWNEEVLPAAWSHPDLF
jgi:hypothetical protein